MKNNSQFEKDNMHEVDMIMSGFSFLDLEMLYENENPAKHLGKSKEDILRICLKRMISDQVNSAKEMFEMYKDWFFRDEPVVDGEIKTLQGYKDSESKCFDEYFPIGCLVAEDVVDEFRNVLPPRTDKFGIMQMGEPIDCKLKDVDKAISQYTYMTFVYVRKDHDYGEVWEYCGNCFAGEIINR